MVSKQALFIIAFIAVFFVILTLMYMQIIILSGTLLLVVIGVFIIAVVMIIVWWWLSRRKKRPIRIGRDFNIRESKRFGQEFFARGGLLMSFPFTHFCYGETRFDKLGNRFHGFAGILYRRVKQVGTGKEATMQPINPTDKKEIGRGLVIINATERNTHSWYQRPYKEQYEDMWKRLPGIISASREPEIARRVREVTPLGVEKEEVTAPVGAPEVKLEEKEVV